MPGPTVRNNKARSAAPGTIPMKQMRRPIPPTIEAQYPGDAKYKPGSKHQKYNILKSNTCLAFNIYTPYNNYDITYRITVPKPHPHLPL